MVASLHVFVLRLLCVQTIEHGRDAVLDGILGGRRGLSGRTWRRVCRAYAIDLVCGVDWELGVDVEIRVELIPAPLLPRLVAVILRHGGGHCSSRAGARSSRRPFASRSRV